MPILLRFGPADLKNIHYRGEEIHCDYSIPRDARSTLGDGRPGHNAWYAVAAFPDIAFTATKRAGAASATAVRPVQSASRDNAGLATAATAFGFAVHLRSIVDGKPNHSVLIVGVATNRLLLLQEIEDSANRVVKFIQARVEIELLVGVCSRAVKRGVACFRAVARSLAGLGPDERNVAVVERDLGKEWIAVQTFDETHKRLSVVGRIIIRGSVGLVRHTMGGVGISPVVEAAAGL